MRVSVAMAAYNGSRFLLEQLRSLSRQERRPAELVLCDDGSSDATLEIASTFAKTAPFPVRIFANPARLGYADNFLKAARLGEGDLIAFCDQDDVWTTDKLARCARVFEKDPETMLVAHNAWLTDEELRTTASIRRQLADRRFRRLEYQPIYLSFLGFTLVFRHRLVQDIPFDARPCDYQVPRAMPHDHWIPFLASVFGDTVVLKACLAYHRQRPNNVWNRPGNGATATGFCRHGPNADEHVHRDRAELFAGWTDCLARLAESAPPEDQRWLLDASQRYARIGRDHRQHQLLVDASKNAISRWVELGRLLANGAYGSRKSGRMGLVTLVKDLVQAVKPSG